MHPLLIRPMEFWKDITSEMVGVEIEDWYCISTEGRVYSKVSNKILKPSIDRDGYAWVGLYLKNQRKQKLLRINRLVLLAFYPIDDAEKYQANHRNGIKLQNDEFNLEWSTAQENVIHAFKNGLHSKPVGESNPMSVISNIQAENIAELISSEKYTYEEIAKLTGCNTGIIYSIYKGKCWRKLYEKYNLQNKHIPTSREKFSFNEIEFICKYFEDNSIKELSQDTKNTILKMLNKPCDYNHKKALYRIFIKRDHTNISSKYNF